MTVQALRRDAGLRADAAALVALAGCLALAARPPVVGIAFGVTVAVGLAGALAVVPQDRNATPPAQTVLVTAAAVAAFGAIRFASVVPRTPATTRYAVMLVVAAFAEELFFRRFLYGLLVKRSVFAAVVCSAVLFALVHVPAYGLRVIPIDLAAGVVLSWQRWATGSWVSSAAAHSAANLMAIL